jgi:HEPN domain-containing protein
VRVSYTAKRTERALAGSGDFRQLSRARLREARCLLDASEWAGAYYIAGYAVEFALKAVITKNFMRYTMPDAVLIKNSYTHDLPRLLQLAELDGELARDERADVDFGLNWAVVKDWNESSRYTSWNETEARDLYTAITQRVHGVHRWLSRRW